MWQELFGLQVLQMLLYVVLCVPPCFLVMHRVLLYSAAYRTLQVPERMVVCQHGVYAVVFGFCLVPQTLLVLKAMFKAWTGDYIASSQFTAIGGIFVASRLVLYAKP